VKKRVLIILSIFIAVILLFGFLFINIDFYDLLEIQGEVGPLAHKIMNKIDQLADADGKCVIDIAELTDFDWDTMVVIDYYCSSEQIKEIPKAIKLKEKGVWSQLIFLKDNKVVYEEAYRASVETSYKFNLFFEYGGQGFKVFTPETAQIRGLRNTERKNIYYSLVF